jgi:hypothetical protein
LYYCPFQELPEIAGIEPGSVRLILTDPPYGKEWLDQWDELGRFAAEYLQDGGLLVTHTGIRYLPKVIADLGKHLTYQWTMNSLWTHSANKQYLHKQVVLSKWLPILVFANGTPHLTGGFGDTLSGNVQEKELHDWQQPVSVFKRLIEDFSQPGDLIADPCGGAFTTAVACHRSKRRFIGCDIDDKCVKIGIARLHDERKVMPVDDDDKPVPYTSRWTPKTRMFRLAELVVRQPMQKL